MFTRTFSEKMLRGTATSSYLASLCPLRESKRVGHPGILDIQNQPGFSW